MNIIEYSISAKTVKSYRIALLSDIHGKFNKKLEQQVLSIQLDIIAISGDYVDTSLTENQESIQFLRKLVKHAYTTFVPGNHDYRITDQELDYMGLLGVHVLSDSWERYNEEIIIGGLASAFFNKCKKYDPKERVKIAPDTEWLNDFEKHSEFKILIDHHPSNYDRDTKNRNIDLILSGHNHGGQIRVFGQGLFSKEDGFFPKYDGGFYDKKLVVSRGLSNTVIIPRFFNPTELVIVNLLSSNNQQTKYQ